VGAGGNAGAFAAGFLFKRGYDQWSHQLWILGAIVTACSFLAWGVRFARADEAAEAQEQSQAALGKVSPAV
jgi:NNP family nitrate/nitrite transporter-like MFS transporter